MLFDKKKEKEEKKQRLFLPYNNAWQANHSPTAWPRCQMGCMPWSHRPSLRLLLHCWCICRSPVFQSVPYFFLSHGFNLWTKSYVLLLFLRSKHHIYLPSYSVITLMRYLIFLIILTLNQNESPKFRQNLLSDCPNGSSKKDRQFGRILDETNFCVCLLSHKISFTTQVWDMCHFYILTFLFQNCCFKKL